MDFCPHAERGRFGIGVRCRRTKAALTEAVTSCEYAAKCAAYALRAVGLSVNGVSERQARGGPRHHGHSTRNPDMGRDGGYHSGPPG